jgi:hypothetical protein
MKKIILILTLVISTSILFSQNDPSYIDSTFNTDLSKLKNENLPEYLVFKGDTIGVVLTIRQLQKLDNDTDLLLLLDRMELNKDTLNEKYLLLINEKNEKIEMLELKVSKLEEIDLKNNSIISDLKSQIENRQQNILKCDSTIVNNDIIIKGLKKDLRKSKLKGVLGWSSTAISVATVIILSIKK